MVTTAKDVVTGRVSGAKGTMSDTLSSAVVKTRGAVQDGMEKTKAVVSGSVSTVLESGTNKSIYVRRICKILFSDLRLFFF